MCIRHLASVYGFNDAMWTKYKLGESQKVMDGGVAATRNAVGIGSSLVIFNE